MNDHDEQRRETLPMWLIVDAVAAFATLKIIFFLEQTK